MDAFDAVDLNLAFASRLYLTAGEKSLTRWNNCWRDWRLRMENPIFGGYEQLPFAISRYPSI